MQDLWKSVFYESSNAWVVTQDLRPKSNPLGEESFFFLIAYLFEVY